MRFGRLVAALVVALLALAAGGSLSRADSPTILLGYQFDLVQYKDNGNNTGTWTYAVTASGDETHALSHWTLALSSCAMPVIAPANGASYTTVNVSAYGCGSQYKCEISHCKAVIGQDPTTQIANGIKFEDCSPQLDKGSTPRTHVFQFTVSGAPGQPQYVAVAGKAGAQTQTAQILGPACAPTGVALSILAARPRSLWNIVALGLAALAALLGVALFRTRNRVPRG